jgi:hypothetical protein
MSVPTEDLAGATAIRPFRVDIPEEALDDLRRRIAATRWPSKELVADRTHWPGWDPAAPPKPGPS